MKAAPVVYCAAAVRDARGVAARPGAVAVRGGAILAAGEVAEVRRVAGAEAAVIDLPRTLILPCMVNAHAHLDLTGLGPRAYEGDFIGWLRGIVRDRPMTDEAIAAAVRQGLAQSAAAGVGYVADIAGSVAAVKARLGGGEERGAKSEEREEAQRPGGASPFSGRSSLFAPRSSLPSLPGVSFVECLGQGRHQLAGLMALAQKLRELPKSAPDYEAGAALKFGLQPHAPYSVGLALYNATRRLAEEREYRLATHLAESPDEVRFVRDAAGPFADLLRALGKWDDTIKPTGLHPVDWLEVELRRQAGGGGWLLAHCNCIEDEHVDVLASCHASVAYCPISSAYFGYPPGGGHRYRTLLEAGVNVCLGTDSILCQPGGETQPLGILPQMRFLYRRDRTDPGVLLRMATTNGLRALGLKEEFASLQPGVPARLVGVEIDPDDPTDPLTQALVGRAAARMIEV